MKTFYYILLFDVTFALGQGTYQVRGRIDGVRPNTKLFLKKQDNASSRILLVDTTRYRNGGFVFRRTLPEVDIYSVSVDSVAGQVSFLFDHDLVLDGSCYALKKAKLTGSPLTNEWRTFEREVSTPFEEKLMALFAQRRAAGRDTATTAVLNEAIRQLRLQKTQVVGQRIRQRPNSLLSLYLLNWYWSDMPKPDALTLFTGLAPPLKTHSVAGLLRRQLGLTENEIR